MTKGELVNKLHRIRVGIRFPQRSLDEIYDEQCELVQQFVDQQLPQWISIKDRLPEEKYHGLSKMVLVTKDGDVFQAWRNLRTNQWDCDTDHDILGITHWMPLPEPPKESEK